MKRDAVVLSAHLDDAVFSAWHALTSSSQDVGVVTVFAGIPEANWVTGLDALHGALESREWMLRRRSEDRAALAFAAREPVHLDLLDVQYRASDVPALQEAVDMRPQDFLKLVQPERRLQVEAGRIETMLRDHLDAEVIYGPVGIGGHPDHRQLARITASLVTSEREVRLYADAPYYLRHGLPSILSGQVNPAADALIDEGLNALELPIGTILKLEVVELGHEALAKKLEAIRAYTTEYRSLVEGFPAVFSSPDRFRHEAYWTIAAG